MQTLRKIAVVAVFLCLYSFSFGMEVQPLAVPKVGKAGFTQLAAEVTGIRFANELNDDRGTTNRNLLSGSGVAAGDVDGDGRIDLFFCGLDNGNALYRNLGSWRFEDVTASTPAITLPELDCTGAAFADVDGDGDADLLVNALGAGTRLFLNDGRGKFSLKVDAGLQTKTGSTSMALADIDGDGDLDLYVTNFRATTIRDDPNARFTIGYERNRPVVQKVNDRVATNAELTNRFIVGPSGQVVEQGEVDALYENDGSGRFTVVIFTGGRFRESDGSVLKQAPYDWGLAVQMRDFTGDGAPDIYVCNDYWTPDRVWINDGRGSFRAAPEQAIRHTSYSSMGVDFADINHDGNFDFFVVDMLARTHRDRQAQVAEVPGFYAAPGENWRRIQVPQNTMQLNRGDGTFSQIGHFCGVEASEWSWNPIFLDVDLDGWEDLLVSNGHRRDFQNADATAAIQEAIAAKRLGFGDRRAIQEMFPAQKTATAAFRNNGDLTFRDVSREWGFEEMGISHGSCLADLDNDGDLDMVVNRLGATGAVYRNEAAGGRVAVRLKGAGKNIAGVGAKIVLRNGSMVQQQEMMAGGRYLSSDFPERVFALPAGVEGLMEVRWRDGKVQRLTGIRANQRYIICEPVK